jgi:hypothetical protein
MNHDKAFELLERYLDKELGPAEHEALEQHVAACSDCRRGIEELRKLGVFLRAHPIGTRPDAYWQGFTDRFWNAWTQRQRVRKLAERRPVLGFSWPKLIAAASACVLLAAVGIVGLRSLRSLYEPTSRRSPAPAPSIAESQAPEVSALGRVPESLVLAAAPARKEKALEAREQPAARARPDLALGRKERTGAVAGAPEERAAGATRGGADMHKAEAAGGDVDQVRVPKTEAARPKSEEAPGVTGLRAAGKSMVPMTAAQRPGPSVDTVIRDETELETKPKLISLPELPDSIRAKYAEAVIKVRVVVEMDGRVSRVELLTPAPQLDSVIRPLVKRARFLPGRIAGRPVRSTAVIEVKLGIPKRQRP